jgi:hypothetical protein
MAHTSASEDAARAQLMELAARHPLPPGWSLAETFLQEVRISRLRLCMTGLVASDGAQAQALGAAAERAGYPVERAYFELLERISIQLARGAEQLPVRDRAGRLLSRRGAARVFPPDPSPERLRLALSNGVALHRSWPQACDAAQRELVERDRVLRSFAGEIAPRALPAPVCGLEPEYAAQAYALGTPGPQLGLEVAIYVLRPRTQDQPLVYGFGAGETLALASARAQGEAEQRLAFLWGEPLPTAAPEPAPTPDYHQEHYLYPAHHARLFAWLDGKQPQPARRASPAFDGSRLVLVDLTPAAVSGSGLYVAKAGSAHARKLRFGATGRAPHPVV